ncbi:hypothetical protein [Pelagibaculum spongiae]|nr:hypothetical protein [Pelagibaculum spongiae]
MKNSSWIGRIRANLSGGLLLTSFMVTASMPVQALVIEETSDADIAIRSTQAEQLLEPFIRHIQAIPKVEGEPEEMTTLDINKIFTSSSQKAAEIIDSKFTHIENDLATDVIQWLEKEVSLEKNLISKLKRLPQIDDMCLGSISSYQTNTLREIQKTIEHLKKYKNYYKAEKFLVLWVFNADYIARIQMRQEIVLLTNICANPGFFTNDIFSKPLFEATYVGKPIDSSLRK